ncbi:MAG: YggS family pyridoxal phosphate-dependent enzyme [Bdellovibrionia bacterium]
MQSGTLISGDLPTRYGWVQKEMAERLKLSKSPQASVVLVAVSKNQPVDQIEALYRLGHRDFGENYVQELVAKAEDLESRGFTGIRWHMIGHLQTNKVKRLIPWVFSVHAVDSVKLGCELARNWRQSGRLGQLQVFIEVNIDEEPTKSGVLPQQLLPLAETLQAQPELQCLGLMCIPHLEKDPRGSFQKLFSLERQLQSKTHGGLSMGMSQDFGMAIEEGATHIRVGTLLFGPRR